MQRTTLLRRGIPRLATVATAVALTAALTGTAVAATAPASDPSQSTAARTTTALTMKAAASKPTPLAPFFFLTGTFTNGKKYQWLPDGKGGLGPRSGPYLWKGLKYNVSVDPYLEGSQHGAYHVMTNGVLNRWHDGKLKKIATGWGQYNRVLSPGTLTRAAHPDLLARDAKGVLWRFQTRADGTLAPRVQAGTGWNAYTQITGIGDFSGDSVPDLLARDAKGVLWMFRGTGKSAKPFAPRARIGSGWNTFNKLVSTGDVDGDRRSDLLARDAKGTLWIYRGTGKTAAPFKASAKIGTGFQAYHDLS
ncbi:FG-GAP repeat domain-containing protein [Streptomyces sp. NPDC003691]